MKKKRCDWAIHHELETAYHDEEWGEEVHDELKLFEMLVLESMQSGLSWLTILKKRETLREAFDGFDYREISLYTSEKVEKLLENPGIIRHRLKINATISNAQAFLCIQEEYGSFDQFIWSFVQFRPIINQWKTIQELPAKTELSDTISRELKKNGFKFVGPTTVYSFMQSIGMVNDHLVTCYKRENKQ